MKTFEIAQINKLENFDDRFSSFLFELKKHIQENEDQELNISYLKTIQDNFEKKNFNFEHYSQLNLVLNNNTFVTHKRDEIETICNIFIKKINFEEKTLNDRSIEKTLDITNEMYSNLSKNLIRLNNNFNRKWENISIPSLEKKTQFIFDENLEERKNAKRSYRYEAEETIITG